MWSRKLTCFVQSTLFQEVVQLKLQVPQISSFAEESIVSQLCSWNVLEFTSHLNLSLVPHPTTWLNSSLRVLTFGRRHLYYSLNPSLHSHYQKCRKDKKYWWRRLLLNTHLTSQDKLKFYKKSLVLIFFSPSWSSAFIS